MSEVLHVRNGGGYKLYDKGYLDGYNAAAATAGSVITRTATAYTWVDRTPNNTYIFSGRFFKGTVNWTRNIQSGLGGGEIRVYARREDGGSTLFATIRSDANGSSGAFSINPSAVLPITLNASQRYTGLFVQVTDGASGYGFSRIDFTMTLQQY